MIKSSGPTEIKVLVKAMNILNALGSEQTAELSLSEIATRLGMHKSTCYHILDTMAAGNYVEKTGPGRYKIGIKLFQVGSRLLDQLDVRERSHEFMADLQRLTGETVFLYLKQGDEAVCVDRIDGRYSSTHLLRVGSSLPLHTGAAPKVFLASRPDAEIEQYLERVSAQPTSRYPVNIRQLWADVESFRRTGTVMNAGDIEVNTHAIGAAVLDHSSRIAGAVSVSWVEALSDNTEEQLSIALQTTANKISSAMGYELRESVRSDAL